MTTPSPIDRAAFDLAIEAARNESPARRRQIDSMLAHGEDYVSVGRFAAQCRQMESLDLMPWQLPPCYADMSASALNQRRTRLDDRSVSTANSLTSCYSIS